MENLVIVRGKGDALAQKLADAARENETDLTNVVVLASEKTIQSEAFDELRSTETEDRAFLACVDTTNLTGFNYIRILEMLTVAIKLGMGLDSDIQNANISIIPISNRIIRLIPKAEPLTYEELRKKYKAQEGIVESA